MRLKQITILCLVACTSKVVAGQTSVRSQVEAALDSWSSRDSTHDAISKISHEPLSALIAISRSKHEPEIRRSHAIALLATFKEASSEHALDQLANDSNAKYRCLALHSLAEQKSHSVLPVLIRKLDDHAICMKTVSTDPAEEHEVYVSDETVRLLEQITGQSFEQETTYGHRAAKPWKEWWAKQKGNNKSGP